MGDNEKTQEIERPEPSGSDTPAAPVEDGKVTVTEEDLETDPSESPQQAEDRKTRRQERRELKETLKQTQARLEAAERRLEEMARTPYQPQQPPAQQYAPGPRPAESPEETEIATIETTQAALITAIRSCPEDQVAGFNKQWQTLERKKQKLIGKQGAREYYQESGAGQQLSDEAIQTKILQNEFSDIYGNEVLRAYAAAEYKSLVHNLRRPESSATAREALMNIRRRLSTPTAPAPTDNQKARYTSTPGRAGASANGSSNGEFSLTRAQMNAARGYTQHRDDLNDRQRAAIWVKEVGKPNNLV